MNVAHPFREGNGRCMRIWTDHVFRKELNKTIDWALIEKEDYLMAMERSPIKDTELKQLLRGALVSSVQDVDFFMKGIDYSYYYEGYEEYNAKEL